MQDKGKQMTNFKSNYLLRKRKEIKQNNSSKTALINYTQAQAYKEGDAFRDDTDTMY